jgi:hypothetical protein
MENQNNAKAQPNMQMAPEAPEDKALLEALEKRIEKSWTDSQALVPDPEHVKYAAKTLLTRVKSKLKKLIPVTEVFTQLDCWGKDQNKKNISKDDTETNSETGVQIPESPQVPDTSEAKALRGVLLKQVDKTCIDEQLGKPSLAFLEYAVNHFYLKAEDSLNKATNAKKLVPLLKKSFNAKKKEERARKKQEKKAQEEKAQAKKEDNGGAKVASGQNQSQPEAQRKTPGPEELFAGKHHIQ